MEVTRTLARYVVNSKLADIPADVRREAVRSVVNWLGCAVGSCQHEAVDAALAGLGPFSGPRQASVLGREYDLSFIVNDENAFRSDQRIGHKYSSLTGASTLPTLSPTLWSARKRPALRKRRWPRERGSL